MKRKDFWKGFGAAMVLVIVVSVAWKPLCRIIPWHSLPFQAGMSRVAKIDVIQSYLEKYYVDELDEDQVEEMLYAGMMAGVGDRYTYYLTKERLNQYMENTNGNFDGIGIEVYCTQEGEVVVSSVMEGKPAETAGLEAGDVIIGVDGEDMRGRQLSDVAAKIRGKEGTEVSVQVLRRNTGKTLDFTMKRTTVVVESVSSRMLEDNIGYISISGFK
ncbi:MAG: S41 family peptidase, partial [Anaerotignum sp.]